MFLMVVAPALSICLALLGLETLRQNIMGWFLLAAGIAYPAGGVIHYFIRREPSWKSAGRGEIVREEKGGHSFWFLLPGLLMVFFAPPLEWLYLPNILPRAPWMPATGITLSLIALGLRIWAKTKFSGLYSGHVEVYADHRLIQTGPYRFVRHPGYSGLLLLALGAAIGYSSWIGLAAIPTLLLPGLAYRILIEERLLMEHFGKAFQHYTQKSKRLFPGIW
jgi:protein-S-isoprenylcysteine O-methyltransferase Ste14